MRRPSLLTYLMVIVAYCLMPMIVFPQAFASETHDGESYITDDKDRPIRVAFPLHDRIVFDAFVDASSSPEDLKATFRRGAGLAIHHSFGLDYPDEEIWWRFRHIWLNTAISMAGDRRTAGTTLLEGTYLRHDKSGFIVIPSAVDLRFPAPFDIALKYSLVDVDYDLSSNRFLAIDVANIALLLDFIRDESYRHRLAIGPVMDYSITRNELDPEVAWTHSFIPGTGGRFIYGWESPTGRLATGAEVQCAAEAELFGQGLQWHRRCTVGTHLEWTLLAINDRPLSLLFSGSAGDAPQRLESHTGVEWSTHVGLRFSLPGRR